MNERSIAELGQRLERFANDRDWMQFHTPKNLAMALSVEVAELSEIFQWIGIKNSITLKESNVTVGFDRRHICGQRRVSLRFVGFLHLPAGTFATFIGR